MQRPFLTPLFWIFICPYLRNYPHASVSQFQICSFTRFGDMFEGVPNFIRVTWPKPCPFSEFVFVLSTCTNMPDLNYVALLVLEICLRVCQILSGSRDVSCAPFLDLYSSILEKLSMCTCMPNLTSVALLVLEIRLRVCQMLRSYKGHVTHTTPLLWIFTCPLWRNCSCASVCQIWSL